MNQVWPGLIPATSLRVILFTAWFMGVGAVGQGRAATLALFPDGGGRFPNIQAALDAAAAGDSVVLEAGMYRGLGNRDLDFRGKGVTLRSRSGDPATCIIDCRDTDGSTAHRGFTFHSAEGPETRLVGVTITGGQALGEKAPAGSGGAFLCIGASPTVIDCVFFENRAEVGGAVACENSSASFSGCVFRRNSAEHGGAVQCFREAPEFVDCRFTENSAGSGGGLKCFAANPLIRRCQFDRNSASQGGGLSCEGGAIPHLEGCLLSGNYATFGGGLVAVQASPLVRHCIFAANSAGSGSALCARQKAFVQVRNSVVAFGIQGEPVGGDAESRADLACCLVYGNQEGDWIGLLAGQKGRKGNLWADPLFVDGGQGDFRLRPNSPCREDRPGCGRMAAVQPSPEDDRE